MKALFALALGMLIIATPSFADVTHHLTYENKTQKCAVTIFVPTKGKIKVERICFNFSK